MNWKRPYRIFESDDYWIAYNRNTHKYECWFEIKLLGEFNQLGSAKRKAVKHEERSKK